MRLREPIRALAVMAVRSGSQCLLHRQALACIGIFDYDTSAGDYIRLAAEAASPGDSRIKTIITEEFGGKIYKHTQGNRGSRREMITGRQL